MYTYKIEYDTYPESPREWDRPGTMYCVHRRYNLGDVYNMDSDEVLELAAEVTADGGVVLPLYLYDHSGITMNTTGFNCIWDSGQVGFIMMPREKIYKEYGWKRITKQRRKKIEDYLRGEVETYDQYLTGEVFIISIIDPDGEVEECIGGYYGEDYAEIEAQAMLKHYNKND